MIPDSSYIYGWALPSSTGPLPLPFAPNALNLSSIWGRMQPWLLTTYVYVGSSDRKSITASAGARFSMAIPSSTYET